VVIWIVIVMMMMMMLIETLLLHVQKNLLPLMVIQRRVKMSLLKIVMNKKIISMSSDKREEPICQKILAQLNKQQA
jgi:hypothetical protein